MNQTPAIAIQICIPIFQLNFKRAILESVLCLKIEVEKYLHSQLKKKKALIFVLIDSEVSNIKASVKLANEVEKIGASAILVGGSSATDQMENGRSREFN